MTFQKANRLEIFADQRIDVYQIIATMIIINTTLLIAFNHILPMQIILKVIVFTNLTNWILTYQKIGLMANR